MEPYVPKHKKNILLFISLSLILQSRHKIQGARILAVDTLYSKSHQTFFQSVLKALSKAGHEVVFYSPYPLDEPIHNYTEVVLDNVQTQSTAIDHTVLGFIEAPAWKCIDLALEMVDGMFNEFIQSDKIQKLLASNEHFDVVFMEFFGNQEFLLILGHVFNAPIIGVQAYPTHSVVNGVFGNTLSLSYIPDVCASFSNKMRITERVLNTIYVLRGFYYVYYQKYLPHLQYIFGRHFPEAPPILDMVNNVSIIFVNDHLTADYARPRTPNIIPIAGIHIGERKQLPQSIKRFMEEATDGIILFSMGTSVPDELQPKVYFDMYINVFRQLRQRVLWKTSKQIQGLPGNVMTVKWIPQQDVVAHKNCVLFITHGGQLSQIEAIHYGVPVLAIPQFWDQHRNCRFYEENGIGFLLHRQDLTETSIMLAIQSVLDNSKYRKNMKSLSQIFRDRPMTPAQTVVYWTEYVLRHGASHLRPASTHLSWYQLALLDVFAVILAVFVFVLICIYFIWRKVFVLILTRSKSLSKIKGYKKPTEKKN